MNPRRVLVALMLALVASAAGLTASGSGASLRPQVLPPPPPACPSITFIGARGSGESFAGFDGVGAAVDRMAVDLHAWVAKGGGSMQTAADPYPADSVSDLEPSHLEVLLLLADPPDGLAHYLSHNLAKYLNSIDVGIDDAVTLADQTVADCPATKLVMAGYSQGAMVVHQAELRLAASHPRTLHRIVGTLLLGDGDRVPDTRAHAVGSSAARAEGIRTYLHGNSRRDVPLPARTANICNAGDLVCDFNLDRVLHYSRAAKVHTSYAVKTKRGMRYSPVLARAANWLGRKLLP